jgi:hypothetical protein
MTIKKKFLLLGVTLALAAVIPGVVGAATAEELQAQIAALQAQLNQLLAQLTELEGGEAAAEVTCTFTRNLYPGMKGDDVKCLQQYLNASGHKLADSGPGSPGNETTYYGSLTRAAVKSWQDANGVEYGQWWGYFGPLSRAKFAEVAVVSQPSEEQPEEAAEEEAVAETGLTVSLAGDTPAAMTIADNSNANFTKVVFTATGSDITISKIYVTRSGNTSNSDIENIKFVDLDGVKHGSVGSLNVDNRAMITFTPGLTIKAGESVAYYIRAGFADGTTGGKTATLGIASADDIVLSDGATISGNFPIVGNTMSVVDMTIGTAAIAEDGTTVDSQPDVGDTDVVVNQFKITAGSTEAITLEQVTAEETGTASLDDVESIELYSVTEARSLGTVSGWNSEGRASWSDLGIVIDKGKTHRFEIRVDVVDGPGLTVNADIKDGSDWLVSIKGNTYGYYITPSGSWNGKGSNNQTIKSGALTVSKSAATPATGNIAPADEQELATFDFTASGEEMKISALSLDFDLSGITCSEITNVALYDANDNIVAGPQDCSSDAVSFTDTFIVPVGTSQYTVKATIATTTSTGDTLDVGINTPATMTVKGMTSNESITPTPASEVEGNTMTVAAGALSATTLTQPVARSVAAGQTDFVWATASLDAGASGEDVLVTALVIEDTLGAASHDAGDIDNVEIWADLTDETSARGDIYETLVSDTKQFTDSGATDETLSFTLTQTIRVPKGLYVKIAVVADLAAGATASETHTISLDTDAGDVTATGADTGSSISVTPTGSGQTMTVASSGTLTVTKDASSPVASIVLGQGSKVHLATFRLAANNVEDLDVDSIKVTDTGAGDTIDTYYFYYGSTLIGQAPGGSTAEIQLADGTVTVPANDYVLIDVKADLNKVDGTYVANGDSIQLVVNASGDIDTTGLSSGSAVDSSDTPSANAMKLYESRPYFAVDPNSPSGTLITGSTTLLAIFDITADSAKDITFENGDGNSLTVSVSGKRNDSDGNTETITLKDEDGNTLDTLTQDIMTSTMVFDFSTNSLTVPAGLTKKIYIYGDTTELGDAGDTIQLWLDDGDATYVDWGINGSGSYNEADKIFKGDIYAGALVTPSGSSD